MDANTLDELIEKDGVEVTEKNYKENTNRFAYDTTSPIPGENTDIVTDIDNITEETALDSLVVKSAMAKARSEKQNTVTKEQIKAAKKQIVDMIMYNEGEAFYQKYHHVMDGATKRKTRRIIERNFDKGKYNHFFTTNNLNEP